ncbi:MAG: site-specific DNA-methyltransferase [Gammaproteobacteria bacterium]
MAKKTQKPGLAVKAIRHTGDKRCNIPPAELENLMPPKEGAPVRVEYLRDAPNKPPVKSHEEAVMSPRLNWAGKDKDADPLAVDALPIYVQEKIQPQAIIDDLILQTKMGRVAGGDEAADMFHNFNGLDDPIERTEFYRHMQNWTNRMILGDSLQVMASLAEKESLRNQVQCIYMDPPYGIKFASNWQVSTKSRTVKDSDETREPEMIRAFRDTWQLGVNSYLSYLRDRLAVARDLLTESGSIFIQISDENMHLVRCVMDEIFGPENFVSIITCKVSSGTKQKNAPRRISDYIIWYAKNGENIKFRRLCIDKPIGKDTTFTHVELEDGSRRPMTKQEKENPYVLPKNAKPYRTLPVHSQNAGDNQPRVFEGKSYGIPNNSHWRISIDGFQRLINAGRIRADKTALASIYYYHDYTVQEITTTWNDTAAETDKKFIVQTSEMVIQRCMLMTTDPGDLVIDPTCGSGTTALVAEQWGRRWITIDTSRVSLALARARIMSGKFDHYLLQDSKEGADKEAEISGNLHNKTQFGKDVKHGFVYERAPHITMESIANNSDISEIHNRYKTELESLRAQLNTAIRAKYEEWEIPAQAAEKWSGAAKKLHAKYSTLKQKRQKEMDASIARNAETEFLVDRPYTAKNTVRVAGPFTVESLSPHRVLPVSADDGEIAARPNSETKNETRFLDVVLENLKKSGVQNTKKKERLEFSSLDSWARGNRIQFVGHYNGGKKAAICVGPEYGTVSRSLLVHAVREAADYFDLLVVLGFAFEAYADEELTKIGGFPVIRARMNQDLHMASRLKSGGGNLFVSFGEPDIKLHDLGGGMWKAEIRGIDIFDPVTGKTKPCDTDDIACWFIDANYNEESFFVRHAYFCGKDDPYQKLKSALKAEINESAWAALYSDVSRPFPKPKSGRIAVKAINHYGDEVMKVFTWNKNGSIS